MLNLTPFIFALFLICAGAAHAQTPPAPPAHPVAPPKRATAVRVADAAIEIDGRLDDRAWTEAPAMVDFIQKEPVEGAAPTERMEIRFVYDDAALYVGARMFKNPGSAIQAPMGRRDRFEQAEHIQIAFDTFHDRRTAYVFGVTASGVRIDRFHPEDNESLVDEGFDPVWRARTHVDEQGWTAELWIPFSQLRFNTGAEQTWGVNVHRYTPTLDEDDYWVPIPRTVTAWSSRFGELSGIRNVSSSRRLELLPYVAGASTLTAARDASNPFDRNGNLEGRVGADIKMGVGPNLTLDATINPDFGQVEADPAEVNISGFETFFAEKRQFFTEGAKLLTLTGANNFFYSRRIGAPPAGTAAGDYIDAPATSTILGAAKLTGRTARGTSIGALAAVTTGEDARIYSRASALTTTVPVAPTTTWSIARVQQEYGPNQSTVSGMASFVHRSFERGSPLAGLAARSALAVAGDSVMRFKGGEYVLTSYGGITQLTGEPDALARVQRSSAHYGQRPDRTYSVYDPTRSSLFGFKAGTQFQRQAGRHWIWSVQHNTESPNFDPNDIGRLTAADGLEFIQDVRWRETTPGEIFRSHWIGTRHTNEWSFGRDHTVSTAQIYANQVWRNFWTTNISHTFYLPRQDIRLTRGGPRMEVPQGYSTNVSVRNRASSQTSWSLEGTVGGDEDGGSYRQFDATLAVRPGARWQFSATPSFFRLVETQQYITSLAGGTAATFGRRYVFGAIDRSTFSMQFRATYTLKPDMTLDVYAEPFAASGAYTNIGALAAAGTRARTPEPTIGAPDFNVRSFRSNVVLKWEYRPGSTMYLVWQQDRNINEATSARIRFGDPFRSLTEPGNNYFVIKTSFWLPMK